MRVWVVALLRGIGRFVVGRIIGERGGIGVVRGIGRGREGMIGIHRDMSEFFFSFLLLLCFFPFWKK